MRAAIVLACLWLVSCGPGSEPLGGVGAGNKLTVVVAVVDSLMPQEITEATPNLNALKTGGTFYAESRSVFAAETIPNHVAMMTGVYPDRSGIAANKFIDFGVEPPVEDDLSVPEELTATTLFTWIRSKCVTSGVNPGFKTGATMSKKYLFEVFEGDAANATRANRNPNVFNVQPDTHWNPQDSPAYIGSPDEHTPDAPTMQQALTQLPGADFMFINLGDVDRSAHAGGQGPRATALTDTDTQVGQLVQALQDSGRWENTVMFLLSDHGMDFGTPPNFINVQPMLDSLAGCFKPMTAIDVGGTDSVTVMDTGATAAEKQAAARAARQCLTDATACATLCPGTTQPANAGSIAYSWYPVDDPQDPAGNMPPTINSKHSNLGSLVLTAAQGYRFSEPSPQSNPLPGNHGHPITLHNTMVVSGGAPWVKKGQVIAASIANPTVFDRLPEQSENIDVAPTVAWLLGLNIVAEDFPDFGSHPQGFDGRILREAFAQFDSSASAASPTVCGRF